MAVLITGGAGYIGSHMVHALLDRGEDVVVIDNLSTGVRGNIPADLAFIEADIGDQRTVRAALKAHKVDAIVHFAGSIVVPDSVADPLAYYHNNTVKSRELIAAAVAEGVANFIFSSTAAVYGMPSENPVRETSALMPISPYGASKLMTEMMLADSAKAYDLRYTALRYFNVAGADPKGRTGQSTPRATHLIKVACQAALGMRTGMEIFGTDFETPDGTGVRDYIHVSDLVGAHVKALDRLRGGASSLVANCGYGRGFSVREVVDTVKAVSGVDFRVSESARRAGDPAALIAASDLARSELGWVPELDDLETIVRHAFTWEAKSTGLKSVA
ncbi:MAG: UDP-glucose 4-epimerase GalE [Hyphomicrobiaceae bacterium]|nr:UDP-glucose 4-epimerase GalE [Hyphomicrobiaceae bacterium]